MTSTVIDPHTFDEPQAYAGVDLSPSSWTLRRGGAAANSWVLLPLKTSQPLPRQKRLLPSRCRGFDLDSGTSARQSTFRPAGVSCNLTVAGRG